MNPGKFVVASALLIPALMFVSCRDTNENPVAPSTPGTPIPQVGSGLDPSKVKLPRVSGAELALAVREDAEAAAQEAASLSVTTMTDDLAPHDFQPSGMLVQCIDGDEGTGDPTFHGEATRFRNGRGCELNTFDGDPDPNNNAAFVITVQDLLKGKLLTRVNRLDFFFAGGPPIGGSPRLSIPIDECEPVDVASAHTTNCPPGQSTDGETDGFAFIDARLCNDGDDFVGALRGEDDPTCNVNYKGVDFPNWTAFESTFDGARIANDGQVTFIAQDQPNHYLIYRVNLR